MTIQEAIDNVDSLKPNSFTQENKILWLSRLDTQIYKEIMKTHEWNEGETDPEFTGYTADTDPETALLAPEPYDEIYGLYLGAMMDFNNQEYVKFNNSNAMYQMSWQELLNYWNRTHLPKGAKNVYF